MDGSCEKLHRKTMEREQKKSTTEHFKKKSNSMEKPIELLSQKQNGSVESDSKDSVNKTNKGSIRGMWKKAFKSLKKEGEHKDKKEKEAEKLEKDSEKRRMNSSSNFYTPSAAAFESRSDENRFVESKPSSRQSSIKRGLLKRKDSKEQSTPPEDEAEQEGQAAGGEMDPVFFSLKCAASMRPDHSTSISGSEENPDLADREQPIVSAYGYSAYSQYPYEDRYGYDDNSPDDHHNQGSTSHN